MLRTQVFQGIRRRGSGVRKSESGAAAIEFVLVFPVLLLVVFGIIGFGVIFAQKLALGNSAREAARYGVVGERTCLDIETQARSTAQTISMSGSAVKVTAKVGTTEGSATAKCDTTSSADDAVKPCLGSATGSSIYVKLEYTSKLVIPLGIVKNSFPIDGQGVFRCEYS